MENKKTLINKALFMYYAALKGDDNQRKIADRLGMKKNMLSNRILGKIDFKYGEIKAYKEAYNVDAKGIYNIFFASDLERMANENE